MKTVSRIIVEWSIPSALMAASVFGWVGIVDANNLLKLLAVIMVIVAILQSVILYKIVTASNRPTPPKG